MKAKRLLTAAMAGVMTLCTLSAAYADGGYKDLDGHWAKTDIEQLSEMGIVQGSDGLIRPDDLISRAELVTLLYNMLGSAGETSSAEYSYNSVTKLWNSNDTSAIDASISRFSDYSANKWYADALSWAVANGIVSGYEDGTVKADNPVTRQEAIVIFMRALSIGSAAGDITAGDAAEVDEWAKDAVSSFIKLGYINGDTEGNINPRASIKRGEAFKLLRNMIGEYIRESGEYSGDYGNKLVIVAGGNAVFNNINCRAVLVGARAGEPEVKNNNSPRVKIFGRKKLKAPSLSDSTSSGSSSNSSSGGRPSSSGSLGGGTVSSASSAKVTLRCYANGGEFSDGYDEYSVKCTNGVRIGRKLPSDPIRDGYKFVGWFSSRDKAKNANERELYDTDKSLTSSISLYAGWRIDTDYVTFKAAKLTDVSAQPQTELVKNYAVALRDENVIKITGTDLKKFVYEKGGSEGCWVAFDVTLSDIMLDALKDGEKLNWYLGKESRESKIDWNGLISDEFTSSRDETFRVCFDVQDKNNKYFAVQLPRSESNSIEIYSIDVSGVKLYDYGAETRPSSGVSITAAENAELMADGFVLNLDINAANTLNASGTLKYYENGDEEGNFIELAVALPQTVDAQKAVIKLGGKAVSFEDLSALRIPVTDVNEDIVITVDFDGAETSYNETAYTIVMKDVICESKPESEDSNDNSVGGEPGQISYNTVEALVKAFNDSVAK